MRPSAFDADDSQWWLAPLREANYDVWRIPDPGLRERIMLALRNRGIALGPSPQRDAGGR